MYKRQLGELLEEWTHKKSVDDLARCMSLNVDMVWLREKGKERFVPVDQVQPGDCISIHTGNIIPLAGKVIFGEAMVNQASLTGESLPIPKPVSYTHLSPYCDGFGNCCSHLPGTSRFRGL